MFHHLAEEHRVLEQDAYVDNILHDDLCQLKQVTANVECILWKLEDSTRSHGFTLAKVGGQSQAA